MAVYKIFPSADATIYSAYPAKNAGRDEVLEVSVKNSQDGLRSLNRALLEDSPYYSYDLAANDNYTTTANIFPTIDIRRSVLQFSNEDLQILKTFVSESVSGSWDAYLKLNLAFAQNLNTTYSLEAYAVSQSWNMGTGKYATMPEIRNGVCWDNVGAYNLSPVWNSVDYLNFNWENMAAKWEDVFTTWEWDPAPAFASGGGSWNASLIASQSFDYMSNKDVNMRVTDIVDAWLSGSWPNYGLILKHPQALEEGQNTFLDLKFFSVDTHTIYPPCIELRWDDSHYFPIGSNYVLNNQFTLTIANNPGIFKQGSVYRFRTAVRDTYPVRQFTTSSVYLKAKYLSQESYWALQDVKTNEMIIDFDENYTKLSADNTSNYFYMYMNGLEPERFYRILVKTKIYSTTFGPLSIYDNEQSIYDALSLYSAEDLALLPAEEVIIDNNLIFKVIK
jgi:hypothetical protein